MINVAVFAPIDETLTYSVPEELAKSLQVGHRILVPLGSRKSVGIVLGEEKEKSPHVLKALEAILDEKPIFTEKQLEFLKWASEYYLCPLGEVLRTALPAPLTRSKQLGSKIKKKSKPALSLTPSPGGRGAGGGGKLSASQQEIADQILPPSPLPFDKLRAGPSPIKGEGEKENKKFKVHLIHGITGSGKTEIYFHLMEKILAQGKSILSLVPEIALTPQLFQRYQDRFGDNIALYHSGLNDTERLNAWKACREGKSKIMLGTRSALFASFEDLGLIIIDEEQDHSYKQEERVRYHARDLAILRAKFEDIPILLGSATPSVESYYKAKTNKFSYHELNERFGDAELPKVEIIDLKWKKFSLLSARLLEEIQANILKGEQSLLLLNRRGFAHYILCEDCGHSPLCPNCEITLTYHKKKFSLSEVEGLKLLCHYCDYNIQAPKVCSVCSGLHFKEKGSGTQKIEEEIQSHFPTAKIARMDRDTMQRKGAHHALLEKLAKHEIDILVGTQMIAKGHDYPNVTLVGILSADSCLHVPDFRSSEETFQLITQMSGRAGRAKKPGRVLLQTFSPDHYSIEFASTHRVQEFYEKELELRSELGYPPFSRLTVLRIQGLQMAKVQKGIEKLHEKLSTLKNKNLLDAQILGPSPCLVEKLRNYYRWQILLKTNSSPQGKLKKYILDTQDEWLDNGLRLVVDIDPVHVV